MPDQPRLTRADIRAYVGSTYYTRGLGYFEQGRVLAVEPVRADEHGVRLRAQVLGSGGRVYRQTIAIRWEPYGASVDGDCDCPVGYNCKHVAAALLEFAAAPERVLHGANGDLAKSWLTRVAAAGREAPQPGQERLVYLLKPATRGVEVELRIVRPLKTSGRLSKGRPLVLGNLAESHAEPAYMQPGDAEILKLLRSISSGSWPMVPVLTGALGHLALQRMMASGRCHWQQQDEPALTWDVTRPLDIAWLPDADGFLNLTFAVGADELGGPAGPDSEILLTDPPSYVDPARHVAGELATHGLRTAQLKELRRAPRLPPDRAESVSRLLLKEFPGLPLPTPTPVELLDVAGAPTVPCVTLFGGQAAGQAAGQAGGQAAGQAGGQAAGRGGADAHRLRLEFAYAGHRLPALPAEPRTVIDTEAGLADVTRDLAAEAAAVAALAALGFAPTAEQPARGSLALAAVGDDALIRAGHWSALLRDGLDDLRAQGWQVGFDDSFRLRFESGDWEAAVDEDETGRNDWFGLRFDLQVDGRRLPLVPIVAPLLALGPETELPAIVSVPLPADGGDGTHRYVDLPGERIRPVLETLRELFGDEVPAGDGSLRLSRFDAPTLDDLAARGIALAGGRRLRDLAKRLRDLSQIPAVEPPAGLTIELRSYQRHGLSWLQFLRAFDLGGILADDMGLGKTVQTLAHVLLEKEAGRLDHPALVVAPTSLIGNWRREAQRFTPDLRVLVLHGNERHLRFADIPAHDLVLTTYPLLPRDRVRLREEPLHLVILDEAQSIKNPRAQAAQVVRELNARHRLCLTGTPMENHLGELWALFDFLLPGFLGDQQRFKRHWRTPIEQHGDGDRRERLARRVAPFLLRRRKQDVLTELPPKTEIVRSVALGEAQASLYEGIRLSMEKRVREAIAVHGMARSRITILDALLKLRQTCCDPRLLNLPAARRVKHSAKLELLMDLLPEQLDEGRRILLFSQFTSMLALIEPELDKRGIRYAKLTGRTKKRDEVIDQFRGGAVDLFLISLKAGGLGLNLTEADTVILYDPWWNPAVEAQAADRAHRIGQDKPVFVYKLLTEQTVEEKILAMQQKKQALAEGIYREGAGEGGPAFTAEDLDELFAPIAE
ncbi:MAG: DEAD/DEAH box helicase [Thiohalocapsa sp.]|uniref:DEAD/DEAH box helicase n=1 Tax=Thiohalocapsa sp. TaxID=2497641 RepID=UPI0025DF5A70|nr:DEAD/DEAH box helicase [Thiohalocapsa sp.]MCG6941995.1 DEAD/DEAH box helicase [Thiohalocapsa sp.]